MKHYIVEMNDNWKPGDCYTCKFNCEHRYGLNPYCNFTDAVEAVEVKDYDGKTFSKPHKVFITEIKK